MENDSTRYYQNSLGKKAATTTTLLDQHFATQNWLIHPSVIPFITYMTVTKNKNLHPYAAPINHNVLNESKHCKLLTQLWVIFAMMVMLRMHNSIRWEIILAY